MTRVADAVVIGAGIAGVSTAYELSVSYGVDRVVIVDPRPPLTLTSDKSTECYRNFWPSRAMVGLMNRSIDRFEEMAEESGNVFGLSRRGYLFVTADEDRFRFLADAAEASSSLGAGSVRFHPGADLYGDHPDGFDVFAGAELLLGHFPYITNRAVGALHVRRAGWLSAQQLGAWMLDRARDRGAELIVDEVADIETGGGKVSRVTLHSGENISAPVVVNAAGPLSPGVARMAGVDLPVAAELHLKVAYRDHLKVVPREAPMIVWSDLQRIDWSQEERTALVEDGRDDLLGELPVFCHGRPEGGADSPYLLALWEYHTDAREPEWPVPEDPLYPEVVMRGMTTMVPGLAQYRDRLPYSVVDGGYYSKTPENRPLIGPAGPDGFHLMAAMSGFGVMVSAGAADLVARHITDAGVPEYSNAFLLSRYDDPAYLSEIEAVPDTGQL